MDLQQPNQQQNLYHQDLEQAPLIGHKTIQDLQQNIANSFIRKVLSIVLIQLSITTLMCLLSFNNQSYQKLQQQNPILSVLAISVVIAIFLMTCCCRQQFRKVPQNYLIILIFTIAEAYLVSLICLKSEAKIVMMAASMTLAITLALTLYAITTKTDITIYGSALFIISIAIFMFTMFAMFTDNKIVHVGVSAMTVTMYGFYLVYDIQLISGNKKYQVSMDDYVWAAIMVYLDVIGLFLEMLKLFDRIKQ